MIISGVIVLIIAVSRKNSLFLIYKLKIILANVKLFNFAKILIFILAYYNL